MANELNMGFGFDFGGSGGFSWGEPQKKEVVELHEDDARAVGKLASKRRTTMCETFSDNYLLRRAYSEKGLHDVFDRVEFENGKAYHCITNGDCDSLSFLQLILRKQDITKMFCSTWCMAAEDILQFDKWIEAGKIKECDFYVGEIFPSSYKMEWRQINDLIEKHHCGRVACFRNHSKIYAGWGVDFPFVIESSANINTNPRAEQTVITISRELAEFYFEWFDKIVSIKKE